MMRAIRMSIEEVAGVKEETLGMLLRICHNVEFDKLMQTDFIVYPDYKDVQHVASPGTIYIYKILPIDDEYMFEELADMHKLTLSQWEQKIGGSEFDKWPAFGLVFRFRSFKQNVFINAVGGDDEFFDLKSFSDPHPSIELVTSMDDYDPRLLDNIQLEDDWKIICQKTVESPDKDYNGIGQIVLREILKRGISLTLEDYTGQKKLFLEKVLAELKKKNLFSEYENFADTIDFGIACACIKCGYQMVSESHCEDLKCPKCGGQMRREERPGIGRPDTIIPGRRRTNPDYPQFSASIEYTCECLSCGYQMTSPVHCEDYTCPKCGSQMRNINRPGVGRMVVNVADMRVEKRGDKWCVVHGHPDTGGPKDAPEGTIIKCFPTEAEAKKMHQAIIISQQRRKAGLDFPFPYSNYQITDQEDFTSYPIAYIGSKRKLMEQIVRQIPKDVQFIVDGFSGCGVVSYTLRKLGLNVVGVDTSKISQVIYDSIVKNKDTQLSDDEIDWLLASPPQRGYMTTLKDKAIHFDTACKKFMDGFRSRADSLPEPKRSLAKASLLASAGTMVYAGYLRDSIHKKVWERMKRDRISMLKLLKQGLSTCLKKFNGHVSGDGGKAHFVRSDSISFLKHISNLPSKSLAYFDPPYISETGSTKTYYKQYNAWEHALFGSYEGLNLGGEWTKETFEQRINELLEVSTKFNYVLFSYRESKLFPKKKLMEMFGKYFTHVRATRVSYKYINFPKKDNSVQEAEFIFLMTNEDEGLDKVEYRTDGNFLQLIDVGSDIYTNLDYHSEWPQIGTAKFLLQAYVSGDKVSLFLRRQLTKGIDTCMRLYKGSVKMDGYTEPACYTLSTNKTGFSTVKQMFTKEVWPELKKDLQNPTYKFIAEPFVHRDFKRWDKEGWVGDAYVINLDRGEYECLTIKDGYREFWYHGSVLKKMYSEKNYNGSWYIYKANRLPFVLTRQADNESWMPPIGYTGLPRHVVNFTPSYYKYWKKDSGKNRREIRSAFRNDLNERLPGVEMELPKHLENPHDSYFSLQHQIFKGISTENREQWHLNFVFGGQTFSFTCESNPLLRETFSSLALRSPKLAQVDGYLPPGHTLNQSKSLLSQIELLDEGIAVIENIDGDYMEIKVEGERVKNVFRVKGDVGFWKIIPGAKKEIFDVGHEDFSITQTHINNEGYLEVEGLLFREGRFKGKIYPRSSVKKAQLEPWHRGTNLAYINYFHDNKEVSRIGIMTKVEWDDDLEWTCKEDNKVHKGASKFQGIVTDEDGIKAILDGTFQTSAEVAHELDSSQMAMWMAYTGVAICHSPAVESSQILKACQGDSCKVFPSGITPRQLNN